MLHFFFSHMNAKTLFVAWPLFCRALNNNQLTGPIPSSLGALSKLFWLDVAYNSLNGSLPVSSLSPDNLGLDTLPSIQHL
jgi:hypothetical protein